MKERPVSGAPGLDRERGFTYDRVMKRLSERHRIDGVKFGCECPFCKSRRTSTNQ